MGIAVSVTDQQTGRAQKKKNKKTLFLRDIPNKRYCQRACEVYVSFIEYTCYNFVYKLINKYVCDITLSSLCSDFSFVYDVE